jgi:hypothetical protein
MLPAAALGAANLSCATKKRNRQGLIPDLLLANHNRDSGPVAAPLDHDQHPRRELSFEGPKEGWTIPARPEEEAERPASFPSPEILQNGPRRQGSTSSRKPARP